MAIIEDKIKIVIKHEAHKKLSAYIKNVGNEVGGLGQVTRDGNTITVENVYLIHQKVTGVSTDLSPEGLATFYSERIKEDGNGAMGKLKLWWHSHYTMGVFWSGTDDATIESFDQETDIDNWMLSIVGNQKGEIKARIDVYKPFRFTKDNLDVEFEQEELTEFDEEIKREISEKVDQSTPRPTQTIIYTGKDKRDRYSNNNLAGNDWVGIPEEYYAGADELDDEDLDKHGHPYLWREWSKSERREWTRLRKLGKKEVQFPSQDKDNVFMWKKFVIPLGTAVVEIDKDGNGLYIPKLTGESDIETRQRWLKKKANKTND